MEEVELTILGSGNAFAPARYWGSVLVGDNVLLDCSPIVLPHLRMMNKDPVSISHILITHLHGDHTLGLPFLYLDSMYITERHEPLFICGPEGVKQKAEDLLELAFPGSDEKFGHRIERRYHPITDEGQLEMGQMSFATRRMDHGGIVAFGYRFEFGGKHIAYSGDTGMCENLKELVRDCDAAIVEMSSVDKSIPGHMNLADLETLVELIRPDGTLIAIHLPMDVPDEREHERIRFAQDKTVISV